MSDTRDLYRPAIGKTVINLGLFERGNIACFPYDVTTAPKNLKECIEYLFGPSAFIEYDSCYTRPSITIKNATFVLFDSESNNADTSIHFANEVLR